MASAAEPVTSETTSPRSSRAIEIAAAAVALAVCVVYVALAAQIDLRREPTAGQMDARTWPVVLGVAGVVVSIVMLAIAVARPAPVRADLESAAPRGLLRVVLTVAISGAFVAAWSFSSVIVAGYRIQLFPIVASLYLFVLLLLFGQRRWIGLVVYPIALTGFIYLLFGVLLRIPL